MSVESHLKKIGPFIHVFPEDDGFVIQTSNKGPGKARAIVEETFVDSDAEAYAVSQAQKVEYPNAPLWFNPKGERRVF